MCVNVRVRVSNFLIVFAHFFFMYKTRIIIVIIGIYNIACRFNEFTKTPATVWYFATIVITVKCCPLFSYHNRTINLSYRRNERYLMNLSKFHSPSYRGLKPCLPDVLRRISKQIQGSFESPATPNSNFRQVSLFLVQLFIV